MARILEDEIAGDPLSRGYSAMTDDELIVSGSTKDRPHNRKTMTGREVRDQIVESEYNALSDAEKQQVLSLTASEDLNPFGPDAAVMKNIFGAASTTIGNLVTARVELISRMVEISWGELTIKSLRLHTISRAQG